MPMGCEGMRTIESFNSSMIDGVVFMNVVGWISALPSGCTVTSPFVDFATVSIAASGGAPGMKNFASW